MEYLSSPREFKDFMRSNIWRDFKHELEVWLEDIHLSLEDSSRDMPDKTLHRLGGNAEVVSTGVLSASVADTPNVSWTSSVPV